MTSVRQEQVSATLSRNVDFQQRVRPWLVACFGEEFDGEEHAREARFLEEAMELFQARGRSFEELVSVARYVFSRPAGEVRQEIGGVMTALAALCEVSGHDMYECGEAELERIWTKADAILEEQRNKPRHSPLPGAAPGERIPENNWEPTEAQVDSACLSYRHDFGMLEPEEQRAIRFKAREWLRAWLREMPKTPALREIKAPLVISCQGPSLAK